MRVREDSFRWFKLALLGFTCGLLAASPWAASAHSVNDYPTLAGWKYSILTRIFYTHPTHWPSSFNARTDDAMAT